MTNTTNGSCLGSQTARETGYEKIEATFAEIYDLGYHDLVAVNGKIPIEKEWQTKKVTPTDLRQWDIMNYSIGIRTGPSLSGDEVLVSIDADALERDLANTIAAIVREVTGMTFTLDDLNAGKIDQLVVRIGMPPKAMYLFRMAKGAVPKGGKVKFFDQVYHQRDPNKFGEIEVRRGGQQFVAFGDHPETNQPYVWPNGLPPYADLPEITQKQLDSIMEGCLTELPQTRLEGGGKNFKAPDQESLKGDEKLIVEALKSIPNRRDTKMPGDVVLDYDAWVTLAYALKAALGEIGWHHFDAFSQKWEGGKYNEITTRGTWNGAKGPFRVGAEWIYDAATLNGWARPGKPTIRIDPDVSKVSAQVEQAIFNSGTEIYRRDFLLVRPVIALSRDNKTISGRFMEITAPYMRNLMARSINFERWDARSKKFVQVPPPSDIAEIILSRVGHWPFHQVNGIIMCQSMRPDGTLILEEGFDEATGLYLLDPPSIPDIPEKPTRDNALEALEVLENLIKEFNFVGEQNKAIGLSGLMTSVARCAIDVAPMHALTAPVIGSGKTYFVNCCAMIATGRRAPAFSAGQSEEELEKRVSSAYLDGSPVILIDNVARELESTFLCIAVEQTRFKVRVLGRSKAPEVEPCSVVFTTGNNLVIVGDLVRRTVQAELDPQEEKPWLRSFDQHPLEMIKADRGKYIAAVLTICRAFKQSDTDVVSPKLESFEQWSDLIASALVWLGKENPINSIEALFENDPERESPLLVIEAWENIPALYGKVAVSEIIKLASKWEEGYGLTGWLYPELHHALVGVAGDGSTRINPTKLGKWLSKHRNRLFNGRMIRRSEKRELQGVHAWWIEKVKKEQV